MTRLQGFDAFEISLGDQLRGERATLGKTLKDVQKELRIKADYIEAIENADISVFPNHGFVAGYVRSYGRYLGLDPEMVFGRFCAESGFVSVNASLGSARPAVSAPMSTASAFDAKDPLAASKLGKVSATRIDWSTNFEGIASLGVIATLLLGLSYGAWSVLQEVQRVEFAPVAQSPVVAAEVEAVFREPEVSTASFDALETLYAPRPNAVAPPLLEPRDGPIGAIDPDTYGSLLPREASAATIELLDVAVAEELELGPVLETVVPPQVHVIATDPAWVRVTVADGSAIFEKILEVGESYGLPTGVDAPMLRAGNAGAVYLVVDEVAYGPLGVGPRVAKDVSLLPQDIAAQWSVTSLAQIFPDGTADNLALAD